MMEEWWKKIIYKEDLIGMKITGFAQSEVDGRKQVLFRDKDRNEFSLSPAKGTKLEIHKQFKYRKESLK